MFAPKSSKYLQAPYRQEPFLVAKINKCSKEQLNKMIQYGFYDDDHYGYLSDEEAIKSFIECYANGEEMIQINEIIKKGDIVTITNQSMINKIKYDWERIDEMYTDGKPMKDVVMDFFEINELLFKELDAYDEFLNYKELCVEMILASENDDASFDLDAELFDIVENLILDVI